MELRIGLVCISHAEPVKVREGKSLFKTEGEPPEVWHVLDWDALVCYAAPFGDGKECRIWATIDAPAGSGTNRLIFKDPKGEPK